MQTCPIVSVTLDSMIGMVLAYDGLRCDRWAVRGADRGRGRRDGDRLRVITRFRADELLVAGRT